jgi:hypothetical protein
LGSSDPLFDAKLLEFLLWRESSDLSQEKNLKGSSIYRVPGRIIYDGNADLTSEIIPAKYHGEDGLS